MDNKKPSGLKKHMRQRYFVARELQLSVALLVILALLGGIFLQSIASAMTSYFGLRTPALGIFLIAGYVALVGFFAIFFSHRMVGPFKRLEYEIGIIKSGELDQRLTVRTKDDLHVRKFIEEVNELVRKFEEMSEAYSKLNSTISLRLEKVVEEMSRGGFDPARAADELKALQAEIHRYREKW
ncbi:MAG: hypothetical protein HY890_04220 [Deltaproteobacteria bacterium]|nr:hypothetical protein [Deltaproteobacteria bacterium]